MLHVDPIFKCEYSSNFNFIVSFQYQGIYVVVFKVLLWYLDMIRRVFVFKYYLQSN